MLHPLHIVTLREVRERELLVIRGAPHHCTDCVQPNQSGSRSPPSRRDRGSTPGFLVHAIQLIVRRQDVVQHSLAFMEIPGKSVHRCVLLHGVLKLAQVSPFLGAAQSTSSEVIYFQIWFTPGFLVQSRQARLDPCVASRDQLHHQLRFCCDSFFTRIFLRSF